MKVLVKDLSDVKKKIAKLIRDYELDKISTDKFRALVYALTSYVNSIPKVDFEERIKALEDRRDIK